MKINTIKKYLKDGDVYQINFTDFKKNIELTDLLEKHKNYKENIITHSWPQRLNTLMTLLSKKEWYNCFSKSGFRNIELFQVNSKNDFQGTLVIKAKS